MCEHTHTHIFQCCFTPPNPFIAIVVHHKRLCFQRCVSDVSLTGGYLNRDGWEVALASPVEDPEGPGFRPSGVARGPQDSSHMSKHAH